MKSVKELEKLVKDYADARQTLNNRVQALEDDVEAVKRKALPSIKHAANKAKTLQAELSAAIDTSRDLFNKPKTMSIHGIKFGLQSKAQDISWENEEQVIKRIKSKMVPQIDVLINTKESLHKSALKQLSPQDLKRLGIEIVPGVDVVIIKDTNSDIDKLVKKLLDEHQELKEAA